MVIAHQCGGIMAKKNRWNETWKDNWKGHYQNPNDPYQARIFNEDHKTKYDKSHESIKEAIKTSRKDGNLVFIEESRNRKARQRDYEIEEKVSAGEGQSVLYGMFKRAFVIIIIFAIIVFVILSVRG